MAEGHRAAQVLATTAAAVYCAYVAYEVAWPWVRRRLAALLPRSSLGRRLPPGVASSLSAHEEALAEGVVLPEEIDAGIADVGGLADVVRQLAGVVRAMAAGGRAPGAPTGVLLHGPPGCGKTLLARVLAAEARVRFIHVDPARLADKWLGESEKNVAALFSLAAKVAPAIVFIDEVDGLTRSRADYADAAHAGVRAQLLSAWDGLAPGAGVVVLGATNRPQDIDDAFLRRMPVRIRVPMPDVQARCEILRVLLRSADALSVSDADIGALARASSGLSGSDLREVVRRAYAACHSFDEDDVFGPATAPPAPLTASLLFDALSAFVRERDECFSAM